MCFLQVLISKSHLISLWQGLNHSEFAFFRWRPTLSGRCSFISDLSSVCLPCQEDRDITSPLKLPFSLSKMQLSLDCATFCKLQYLYSFHFEERGHLKGFLPQKQLTLELHAEEDVLSRVRLNTEAVLAFVHQLTVLK